MYVQDLPCLANSSQRSDVSLQPAAQKGCTTFVAYKYIAYKMVWRSCFLDLALLLLVHRLVSLLAHKPINGGGRCPVKGILHVSTGIISLVCKQTRKHMLWIMALSCCKGKALCCLCYPAAVSLLCVNPSYHRANA